MKTRLLITFAIMFATLHAQPLQPDQIDAFKKEKKLAKKVCVVNQDDCISCFTCVRMIACPALIKKGEKVEVDPNQCIGCGMCRNVCPKKCIEVRE